MRFIVLSAAVAALAFASAADAKSCKDAQGHFVKCPAPAAAPATTTAKTPPTKTPATTTPPARNSKGQFTKSSAPAPAAPAKTPAKPAATAPKTTASRTTPPKCKTGVPCGNSCIPKGKVCHKT